METKSAILIVGDDPNLAANLQNILELEGYRNAIAGDSQAAISLNHEQAFALAIVDIKLPDMSGLKLIEKLAELSPTTEYIIITGYASLETAIESVGQRHIVAYETKPLNIDHILSLVKQVTQRKQAEEELRQSENRYSTLVEKGSDGIVVLQDGLVKFANPKAAEMTGLSQNDLMGKPWVDFVAPQYRELTMEKFKRRVAGEDVPSKYEMEILNKDGSGTLVEVNAGLVEYDGKPAVLSIVRDITRRQRAEEALRESEKRYRTLVDNAPVGVYRTNLKGDILYVNDAYVKMLGFDSAEEIIAAGAVPRYQNRNDRKKLMEELNKNGKVNSFEVNILTKTGETRQFILSAVLEGETLSGMAIDITEHKQAEELFRTMFDRLPIGIYITQDGKIQMANPQLAKLIGRSQDGVFGRRLRPAILAEDKDSVRENVMKMLKGKRSAPYEYRLVARDGSVRWVMETLTSIEYQGRSAIMGSSMDITEHKQAEQALQENEKLYHSLFNNMLNGFAYCRMLFEKDKPPDFVYLSVNDAFEVLTGLKNVVGKKVSDVIPGIQESDPGLFEIYGRVALSGIPERFETYVHALEMWFSISVYSPAKEYFVAVFDVITERKRAEKAIEAQKEMTDRILASTPNAILVVDRDLKIVLANRAFYRTFKVSGAEGKLLSDVIHIQGLDEAISRTLAEKSPQLNLEFRYEVAMGEMILLAQITPMAADEVLLILRDITAERARQEQLKHVDRLASIGEMAAGVAHELNNPLTGVVGYSELLLGREVPQDVQTDIEVIHRNAQRAITIVRSLLAFSRRQELNKQRLSINDTIRQVLEMRGYQLKVSNIEVVTQLATGLPDVLADAQQLEQVFLNIILNAEQAMLEVHNRGTLTIRTGVRGGMVRVVLSDDGPGIPAENLWRVFNPFFTTKEPGKGTGLGLSICHGIVAEHGGRIYAESKVGEGATFFVELPVAEAGGVHPESSEVS